MNDPKQDRVTRGTWYIMKSVLIALGVLIAGWFALMTGLNAANIYILASEGMQLRADCVLTDGNIVELTEYFTQDFLAQDEILYKQTYDNYTVTDFVYKLSVERIVVFPWSKKATIRTVERVNATGSINKDALPEGADASDYTLPEWTPGRYDLHFIKQNGRWYIEDITLIELSPSEKPLNTPDMSLLEQ